MGNASRASGWGSPAGDGRPSAARDLVGHLERARDARHLERHVDAALRRRANLRDAVRVGGVERVRRAQRARGLELRRDHVDRHDAARAREVRGEQRGLADASGARTTATSVPGVTFAVFTTAPTPG